MTVTLFYGPGSPFAMASYVLAKALKLDVKFANKREEGKADFEKLFSPENRFVPAIYDDKTGKSFNQSIAVNDFLLSLASDKKGLLGREPEDYYQVLQWESIISGDVMVQIRPVIISALIGKPVTAEQAREVISTVKRYFDYTESHLRANTYLVGEQLTVADIFGASAYSVLLKFLLSPEWRKEYPSTVRWVSTVVNDSLVKEYFAGHLVLPKEDPLPGFLKGTPAAAPQPEKKLKHPLEALGKASHSIDEVKRNYSNKDTRKEFLPWFWNEFYNDEEWSLWKVDYKYNDELTLTFMSNNLIGGFFNRLLASTKYIFGCGAVYGENNNNGIECAFVIRGKDHVPVFDVAPDMEVFDFTRLDASKPEDREFIGDLWSWDKPLVINGEKREIYDGKVFK